MLSQKKWNSDTEELEYMHSYYKQHVDWKGGQQDQTLMADFLVGALEVMLRLSKRLDKLEADK